MKNYYDELEISKNASKEVIEKVYKVLAKKYHPDMHQGDEKKAAEEKFKKISEAYEVLSNDEKRKKYDLELEASNQNISYDKYMNVVRERDSLNNNIHSLKNEIYNLKNHSTSNYYSNANHTNSHYANNSSMSQPNYNNASNNKKSKKQTYYYTSTGEPASALAYYIYKIKKIIKNIFIFLLAILAILLALNAYFPLNIFKFFSFNL